jgi:hypothetical protein
MGRVATKEGAQDSVKSTAGVGALSKAYSDALDAAANTASLVTQCVTIARKFYKGKPIPEADMTATLDKIAIIRKWSEGSAKVRRSEAKNVLTQYALLGDAIAKFRKKNKGNCSWHQVVTLARELTRANGKVNVAVAALVTRASAASIPVDKLTKKACKMAIGVAVNRILKMKKMDRDFRVKIARICEDYGVSCNKVA